MANKTVTLNSYLFNGRTGLTLLLLHPSTGAIGNGAGDTLTPGSNGQFSAVVTEAITGAWRIVVADGSVSLIEDEWVYFPSDVEGTYPASGMRLDIFNSIGDVTVIAAPISAEDVERVKSSTIRCFTGETGAVNVTVRDANKVLVDLTGRTLRFKFTIDETLVHTIESGGISISGSVATFNKHPAITGSAGEVEWSCRDVNLGDEVIGQGKMIVTYAP